MSDGRMGQAGDGEGAGGAANNSREQNPSDLGRRAFVRAAAGAAATLTGAGLLSAPLLGASTSRGRRAAGHRPPALAPEPWGSLVPVAEDAWAVISTPLASGPEARRTVCNGGLVAGKDAVLAIEGFASPAGATWLAAEAERLVGRPPTHVVLTHYHADHTGGTVGYVRDGAPPTMLATETTRRLTARHEAELRDGARAAPPVLLPDHLIPDQGDPVELDLGGRHVRLVGRAGHTPSDLVVELGDAPVIFTGDLVWIGMFPNYVDAIPSLLSRNVRALRAQNAETYVSGHGTLGTPADLDRYIALLDHVETAARRAVDAGLPVEQAAADYTIPASLGSWHMFSPRYAEMAFRAWARELAD